jgi:hypothetical protein
MFVYDIIGYQKNETSGDEEVKESIRFQSIVDQWGSAMSFLITQNETRPGIRWVMHHSTPQYTVSFQENGGQYQQLGKFLDKFIYYSEPRTSDSFFQPTHVCELKPWLLQPERSRTCWLYCVLNGLITSKYFASIIQLMADSRDNSHGGGLGCLWLPRKDKEVARKAILDAFVNSKSSGRNFLLGSSEQETEMLVRETRGYISASTDAPGIAQNYITMILDFLDIKYKKFTFSQTYCPDIDNDEGVISEDVIIVYAPINFLSAKNWLQYKFKGNICEGLESKGFNLDHCVMRLSSNLNFARAHYVTGIKVCGEYFILDSESNILIPVDWTNLDNLPTPGLNYNLDELPIRAYAYLVYVRKPPLLRGANADLGSRAPTEPAYSRDAKPKIDQEGGNTASPTLFLALLASVSVLVMSTFVGSVM